MKQILQNYKTGKLKLIDIPPPICQSNGVLVQTKISVISVGTERMSIDLAKKSYFGKAKARPDLVKQVITKAKNEGLLNTYKNVISKLDQLSPLGYSASGIVISVGDNVTEYSTGDRVAIAGASYANHAEINFVPKNLIVKIPDTVSMEMAAYTTISSIALQGIRKAKPNIGDSVVVIGLGLIGLITIQILKENGCKVIGVDLSDSRIDLAKKLGVDHALKTKNANIKSLSDYISSHGADHTIITAATKSSSPIELAGGLTRKRGNVVVVGAVGMTIPRDSYYKKELNIIMSTSYGPGRYDYSYEEEGKDYPYDFVRWTENRNMLEVIHLMEKKRIDTDAITTHRYSFENSIEAYQNIQDSGTETIGVVLNYSNSEKGNIKSKINLQDNGIILARKKYTIGCSFIGAGTYASLKLIPILAKKKNVQLNGILTNSGYTAYKQGHKHNFQYSTSEIADILKDKNTNAIFVCTRHSTHYHYTSEAIKAGKSVFVEKPIVINNTELESLKKIYIQNNGSEKVGIIVGHNRRFSPMIKKLKRVFVGNKMQIIYRINSGPKENDFWQLRSSEGGGLLISEMSHFIDTLQFLTDSDPVLIYATGIDVNSGKENNLQISLQFQNGSIATIVYNIIGNSSFPKERIEVFGAGNVGIVDDFKIFTSVTNGKKETKKSSNQNKGQKEMIESVLKYFSGEIESPLPFNEIESNMKTIFGIQESIRTGKSVLIGEENI